MDSFVGFIRFLTDVIFFGYFIPMFLVAVFRSFSKFKFKNKEDK